MVDGGVAEGVKSPVRTYLRGGEDPLPELRVQYADYACGSGSGSRVRFCGGSGVLENGTGGGAGAAELTADHVRQAEQEYAGDVVPVRLDEKLTRG